MSKVLSVCVPSYNMEKYLNRCIDSFLVPEVLDQLEIIIVNDGSTDGTLSIANEYKTKYPQSIVVIDKPNGHYGSCVNASLKVATGKYFRIVDADDWVDSDALVTFINTLERVNVDCVCTKRTKHDLNKNTRETDEEERIKNIHLDKDEFPVRFLRMHNLTYLAKLLKKINYHQTEGICYTDTEYAYFPLSNAKTVEFVDVSLYQYFVGRDDQSMSPNVINKNISHLIGVLERVLSYHQENRCFNNNESLIFSTVVYRLLYLAVPIYILYSKKCKEFDTVLKQSIEHVEQIGLVSLSGVFENKFWKIPYVAIWYNNKLFSQPIIQLFRLLNRSLKL